MNIRIASGLLVSLALAGCASSPEPAAMNQITRAETAVTLAERSGARQYATQELDAARTKVARAQRALDEGDDELALRLATEAELDAQLAVARAEQEEAQAALDEVRSGIDTLRQEIDRTQSIEGVQQ